MGVFVENILQKVIQAEKLPDESWTNLKDRIDLLNQNGYLISEIRDALHRIRQIGNQAAHDTRMFRYSETLLCWEDVYRIVKWYVEVYQPVDFSIPDYQDPSPQMKQSYEITKIEERLKTLEKLLIASMEGSKEESEVKLETAATQEKIGAEVEPPGFTTIRTITYKDKKLEIPYFLRDAFLLPQRFPSSETFLIRLGAEQQARIMSELPNNLEGLHNHVKRYNEKHDENFFDELKIFIEEEKIRRQLTIDRPGELFYFFKADHLVVTEKLSKIPLTTAEFNGIPNLLRQLNEDQMDRVAQLPKELLILAKYDKVGIGTVEKLFDQLKKKQQSY